MAIFNQLLATIFEKFCMFLLINTSPSNTTGELLFRHPFILRVVVYSWGDLPIRL
jgi:hypothetical protein